MGNVHILSIHARLLKAYNGTHGGVLEVFEGFLFTCSRIQSKEIPQTPEELCLDIKGLWSKGQIWSLTKVLKERLWLRNDDQNKGHVVLWFNPRGRV